MNLFEFLDNLLFGPTLYYEIVSRYSLEDSLSRLKAGVKPWYRISPFCESGLVGSVRRNAICLRWDDRWFGRTIVRFRGRLTTDASGVRLAGTIAVPFAFKIIIVLIPFVMAALAFSGVLPIEALPQRLALLLMVPVVLVVIVVLAKIVDRNGRQSIADTLDSILS